MIQTFPSAIPIPAHRPIWTDFAETIVERLRMHHGKPDVAPAPQESGWHTHNLPSEDLSRCPGFEDLQIDGFVKDGEPKTVPVTDTTPQPVKLPLREHLNAMRLAATFKTEAAFLECLYRRSITLLDGFLADDLDSVNSTLSHGLVSPDWRFTSRVPSKNDLNVTILLRPDLSDGELGRHGTKIFLKKLEDSLESAAGIVVLCPHGTGIPNVWRDGLPKPLPLVSLSRDIAIELLRHSHPAGDFDDAALRQTLPTDRVLATLPFAILRLAMREPNALSVAARLTELALPRQESGIALRDLVGYGRAKDLAIGIVDDLAKWSRGDLHWSNVSRGLLLSGPPGCGKTELARAIARENGLTFVSGSYAAWQKEGHLGDFLKAMTNCFATAISGAPAVIFLDELDAFSRRGGDQNTHNASYNSKCVAGLLEQLDGVLGREGVVVIAATNHADHIDPAIIRSGRFDDHVAIGLPDRADLAIMLRQHLSKDLPDADLNVAALRAFGATGADIASAVRNARAHARRAQRALALDDLMLELSPPASQLSPAMAWRAAIHEAGHAIAIAALGMGKLIAIKLDGTGGACLSQNFVPPMTAADFHRTRVTDLGGRAAELLVCGEVSAGAGGPRDSDIGKATMSILREEMTFGMGTHGSVWLSPNPNPLDILRLPAAVQQRLRLRIAEAETEAARILQRNRSVLIDLATALVKAQLLAGDALQSLIDQVALEEDSTVNTASWEHDSPETAAQLDANTEQIALGGD